MTWTYSGDPSGSDRDAVRFLIGDTDTTDQQLSDEEIAYLLTAEGSVYAAALGAARSLAAKYARKVDKSVGDLRISYGQLADHYAKLEATLKHRFSIRSALPFAGGTSVAQKDTVKQDTDRVDPFFARNQFDHPGAEVEPDDLESDQS